MLIMQTTKIVNAIIIIEILLKNLPNNKTIEAEISGSKTIVNNIMDNACLEMELNHYIGIFSPTLCLLSYPGQD